MIISFSVTYLPAVNTSLPDHQATSLDKFYDLPAKSRCQLCYVHPSIIRNMFPTGIEKLKLNTRKPELDKIMAETIQGLAKIREEQNQRKLRKVKMNELE